MCLRENLLVVVLVHIVLFVGFMSGNASLTGETPCDDLILALFTVCFNSVPNVSMALVAFHDITSALTAVIGSRVNNYNLIMLGVILRMFTPC